MQTTKIQAIQDVTNTWGSRKKRDLIALGEGKKNYPEILAYLENEIANSQKMVNFRYKIPCFRMTVCINCINQLKRGLCCCI
jgi:hypothetical protein